MKKTKEEVKITLLGNNEKDYLMALDINGEYYSRNTREKEDFNDFLARVTIEHYEKTGINIFPYFKNEKKENIIAKPHSIYMDEKNHNRKKKTPTRTKKSPTRKKWRDVSKAAAAIVIATTLAGSVGCSTIGKNNVPAEDSKSKAKTEQDSASLKDKSNEELMSMLSEKSNQKEAIQTILDTKDYFNVQAAPSIVNEKDAEKNAQLNIHTDEDIALYMYANMLTIGPTEMNKIFGQSKFIWVNSENDDKNPIYERGTPEYIKTKLDKAIKIKANYYKRATEPSGISNLFMDEEEKQFFKAFEDLVLDYNRTGDENTKKEIQAVLKAIFASNDIDTLGEQFPGASIIIAKVIAPALLYNGAICEKGYVKIQLGAKEIEDIIEASLDQWDDIQKTKKIKESNVVSIIMQRRNLDIVGLNRNITNLIEIPEPCHDPCVIEKCNEERSCETFTEAEQKCIKKFIKTCKKPPKKPGKTTKKGCKYYKVSKKAIPKPKDSFVKKTIIETSSTETHIKTGDRSEVEKEFDGDIDKAEEEGKQKADIEGKNAAEEEKAKNSIENNKQEQNEKVQQQMEEYDRTNPTNYTKPVEESAPTQPQEPAPTQTEVIDETDYDNDGNIITSSVKRVIEVMVNGKEYVSAIVDNGKSRVRS